MRNRDGTMTTTKKPDTYRLTLHIRDTEYGIIPLRPDPGVAFKAYRLRKHGGDAASYDVRLDSHGAHCECLGFLRWRKPCKHIRTLQNAGMI
jgi:hypothetical protein